MSGGELGKNPSVGAPGHGHIGQFAGVSCELLERECHGAEPRATGQHKRAVDVEKDDLGQKAILAFAANVPGARPLGRWLLFEVDALSLVQLVEVALYR